MPTKKKDSSQQPVPLQAQMDQLSELVVKLEDPALPLEEALELYEQGIKMVEQAQLALDNAQQRMAVINANDEVRALEE